MELQQALKADKPVSQKESDIAKDKSVSHKERDEPKKVAKDTRKHTCGEPGLTIFGTPGCFPESASLHFERLWPETRLKKVLDAMGCLKRLCEDIVTNTDRDDGSKAYLDDKPPIKVYYYLSCTPFEGVASWKGCSFLESPKESIRRRRGWHSRQQ